MEKEPLTSLDEQIAFFESLRIPQLKIWLEEALRGGKTNPIWLGDTKIHFFVVHIFHFGSPGLQRRIRSIIYDLIKSWIWDFGFKYLDYLVYLAGRLRIVDTFPFFLTVLREQKFKDKFADQILKSYGEDLHLNILRTIGPLVTLGDEKVSGICLRDIEDAEHPQYFAVCYRILYHIDIKYAELYFHKLVRWCIEGYFTFKNEFSYLNDMWGNEFFINLDKFQSKLTELEKYFLLISLYNALKNDKKLNIGETLIKRIEEDEIYSIFSDIKVFLNQYQLKKIKNKLMKLAVILVSKLEGRYKLIEEPIVYIHDILLMLCGLSRMNRIPSLENTMHLLDKFFNIISQLVDINREIITDEMIKKMHVKKNTKYINNLYQKPLPFNYVIL